MDAGSRRLLRELASLRKEPVPWFHAQPDPKDIFRWHFVLFGPSDSVYRGGAYHGKIVFPKEYPFKPPSLYFTTPNGRFQVGKKICVSMTDFHEESWQPLWGVRSILVGVVSFMLEESGGIGSIRETPEERRRLATQSWDFNDKDVVFRKMFPDFSGDKIASAKERVDVALKRASGAPQKNGKSSEGSIGRGNESQTGAIGVNVEEKQGNLVDPMEHHQHESLMHSPLVRVILITCLIMALLLWIQ